MVRNCFAATVSLYLLSEDFLCAKGLYLDWLLDLFIHPEILSTDSLPSFSTRFMGNSKKDLEWVLALGKLVMWLRESWNTSLTIMYEQMLGKMVGMFRYVPLRKCMTWWGGCRVASREGEGKEAFTQHTVHKCLLETTYELHSALGAPEAMASMGGDSLEEKRETPPVSAGVASTFRP